MFKSIHYIKYIGHDPKTKLYSYLYKIVDEDFEEEITGAGVRVAPGVVGVGAVMNCYSKRNLNVPKNLLLLFQYYEKQYGKQYYSIDQQIEYCIRYQPIFQKYKEDVEKYLILA